MSQAEYEALKARCAVRVQWDPERDLLHRPLAHRAIQIGLSGEAVRRYVSEWIVAISEVTAMAQAIEAQVIAHDWPAAERLLPDERPYTPR
jgi:hypothetical protein